MVSEGRTKYLTAQLQRLVRSLFIYSLENISPQLFPILLLEVTSQASFLRDLPSGECQTRNLSVSPQPP